MRWHLFLLFFVIVFASGVEGKNLNSSESIVLNKFFDGKTSVGVSNGEDATFYVDIPKSVGIVEAYLSVKGVGANDVIVKFNKEEVFRENLNGEVRLNLTANISTDCEGVCDFPVYVDSYNGSVSLDELFINYSFSKTPLFLKKIEGVEINDSEKNDVFDLDEHFYGEGISYKKKIKDLDCLSVDIDSNNEVSFVGEENCYGMATVTFVADDDEDNVDSNDVRVRIVGSKNESSGRLEFSPTNGTLIVNEGEQISFGVDNAESVDWFLDDVKLNINSTTYIFDASSVGVHSVTAKVGSLNRVWSVSVLAKEVVEPSLPSENVSVEIGAVCGNGISEEGENCVNCPVDVKCSGKAVCVEGSCVVIEEKGVLSKMVLWLGIFGGILVIVVFGVIILRKRGLFKKKESVVKEGFFSKLFRKKIEKKEEKEETKEDNLGSLRSYFLESLKKGYKKEDLVNSALQQGWKKEEIDKVLEESERIEEEKISEISEELKPLENYLRENLKKGYRKEDLVNAALQQGWKKEEIDGVLKRIWV